MAINLMALTPHQVSRDLSGYITYLYGQPKVGKTTLVSQFQEFCSLPVKRVMELSPELQLRTLQAGQI